MGILHRNGELTWLYVVGFCGMDLGRIDKGEFGYFFKNAWFADLHITERNYRGHFSRLHITT
jgi:hypothetical protein